jgi:hypothetical protein
LKGKKMTYLERAVELVRAGKVEHVGYPYYGDVKVSGVGDFEWEPEDHGWVVRVREEDIVHSCGMECCGVAVYALQFISQEDAVVEE